MASNTKQKKPKVSLRGRTAQWEWENDRSIWQQYSTDVQEELTRAFDQGQAEVRIRQTEEISIIVHFSDMIERNDTNELTHRIRLALELKDKNGVFFYEYQNDKKKWEIYNATILLQIAQAIDDDEMIVRVTTDDNETYEIDLDRLTEKNLKTDRVRKLHCIRSMAKMPLHSSTIMNKRSLINLDELEENPKKRRSVSSKSMPIERDSIRTIKTTVGQVPVDAECVKMIDKAHVYRENNDVFDCMLNQTNVGNNNNKFYLIQLLEENQDKHYYIWLRWGRVGYNGQNNLMNFGTDLDEAKRFFCQKFLSKTNNDFYFRAEFIKYPGKYDYVQLDYNPTVKEKTDEKETKSLIAAKDIPLLESKLDPRVQNLIRLICNVQAMEEALLEMKFDARKNPLGKLSANQIKAGYQALKEIEHFIKKHQFNSAFIEANNTYYTRIPHEFGRSTPTLIKTIPQLKNEIELLEALDEIEVVLSNLQTDDNVRRHPIDQQYELLKCHLCPVNKNEEIYMLIEKYLHSTHASTHQQYQMEIEEIFQVDKEHEKDMFNDVGNKMLLWHGSRLTNFAGILTQGLRIAPPEAPVTGYMFGKGLYFADLSSKSANYCYPTPRKNVGLVLLSEVALGQSNELLHADNHANKLPKGLSSVKGLGSSAPNPKNAVKIENDLTIPMGPIESTNIVNPKGYTLNYNEYIVYDTKQVRMRYLIKLKFNFK